MDPAGDPSPSSRRSVKRRPPARSPELSPKAGGGEATELILLLEELDEAAARLRGEKEAAEEAARGLQAELEAERVSAETATSEAMLMIERLQREKAAAQMEARQFRRYAEGRADREREVQEELASLSDLAASYHSRLQSHGIDPDSFSDDEEEVDQDEEEGEEVQQIDTAAMEADRSSGGSSSFMQVKAMVDDDEEEQFTPVEKEFEYTVDVRCASTTTKVSGAVVVGEYVGESNVGGLYARVEALEANRAAMRSEIAALRAERAQLVMARARAMARRLCWEVVAEQKAKKKVAASSRSFSVLGVCKWVLSIIFWRNRSSAARYTFGLSTTFLGFLLLLDRSTMLSPWCRLPRPER